MMPGLGLGGSLSLLGLQPTKTITNGISGACTDRIGVTGSPGAVRGRVATASEAIHLNDAPIGSYGPVIREIVRVALSQVITSKYGIAAQDQINVHDQMNPGIPVLLSDAIHISLSQSASQVITVMEALHISGIISPRALYGYTVQDAIVLADALTHFFGGTISEHIGAHDVAASVMHARPTISEHIGVAPTLTPKLLMQVVVAEDIHISPTQALKMIFGGEIAESIQIVAGYVSPDGQFTTWAMNTRTGAVTEYSNYAFNSFARIENIYYGANSTGLYKLLGDDDAGDDIIADIKSGFAQFAGSRFTLFKGVYLGVRGTGDFVLKVITGDDETYIYTIAVQNQQTTKISIGKGIRTRYFAFELVSTGQDFDLDTVEFVPLVADRRV